MSKKPWGWLAAVVLILSSARVPAASNVLFILDVSGSMAGRMDGQVKMVVAKDAFGTLLAGLPREARVGLEVYGHYGDKDCSAIEVMSPVGPLDAAAVSARVRGLTPRRGATPMAAALEKGAEALRPVKGEKAIVLISDGKETCGGDPAAVAARLRGQGFNIVTHVVGLGVKESEKTQLAAIAKAGGGQYYAANNADELNTSLAAIKKKVLRAESIFRDDFDGDFVNEQWDVVNADSDSAVVEDGMYQVIAEVPEKKLFNAKNMLFYKGKLPNEWEAEARVLLTLAVPGSYFPWHDVPFVGLVLKQDDDNALVLAAGMWTNSSGLPTAIFARLHDGKWEPGFFQEIGKPPAQDLPVGLKLVRRGRVFEAFYQGRDEAGKTIWKSFGIIPLLRAERLRLGVMAARGSGSSHEQLEKVDWVEVREPK